MKRALASVFLLLAAPAAAAEEPFEPGGQDFADAASCKAHLARLALEAKGFGYAAIEGPYDVAPGDVRAHFVSREGSGHRITEHRCHQAELSSRSWTHSMAEAEPEFTVESVARTAEWLKKGADKQE